MNVETSGLPPLSIVDGNDDGERSSLYAAARKWHRRGYNVVPQALDGSKHPAVKWRDYQESRVTAETLEQHFQFYERGVGCITGAVSGVIVIESDGPEGEAVLREFEASHGPLPETLTIRSGGGRGIHRHFRHPGYEVKTIANESIKLDVRGDGGFCMLPPSLHKSGGRYQVVHDIEPAELPQGLLEFIELKAREANTPLELSRYPVGTQKTTAPGGSQLSPIMRTSAANNLAQPIITNFPLPSVNEMSERLKHLASASYFTRYQNWLTAGMALKASGYDDQVAFDLWALTHNSAPAITIAPAKWQTFSPVARPGYATLGTLIYASNAAGFVPSLPQGANGGSSSVLPFTGQGGDVFNGKRLAEHIRGRLLHIHETGEWLQYAPLSGWTHAAPGEVVRAAKEVLAQLHAEAANAYKVAPDNPKTKALMRHADRTSQAAQIRAMIDMVKSEPGITERLSEFDVDPRRLGVANGVLDLRTGVLLLPSSPDILVSKRCNVAYDPDAECPRFEQFMSEIQPDPAVRQFLQRWIGYGLTGLTSEQKFAFFYGSGANGKSVFIEIIAWLLGDYAHKMPTEALMSYQRNPQGASPEIVALKGVRYAYANETVEGRHLDEARVKDMTGGDTLTGRAPYSTSAITFQPTHKLSIAGNHKPEISDASFGMWRRVMLVPFDQTIPEGQRDPKLFAKLKAEGSGILSWALRGLRDWQKDGLQVPQSIAAATEAYRDEQDIIADWIGESCDTGPALSVAKSSLYLNYKAWTDRNGHKPIAQGRLTRRLNERGYKLQPDKRTVQGLALKPGLP